MLGHPIGWNLLIFNSFIFLMSRIYHLKNSNPRRTITVNTHSLINPPSQNVQLLSKKNSGIITLPRWVTESIESDQLDWLSSQVVGIEQGKKIKNTRHIQIEVHTCVASMAGNDNDNHPFMRTLSGGLSTQHLKHRHRHTYVRAYTARRERAVWRNSTQVID